MNGKLWKSGITCLSVHVHGRLYFPVSLFRPYLTLEAMSHWEATEPCISVFRYHHIHFSIVSWLNDLISTSLHNNVRSILVIEVCITPPPSTPYHHHRETQGSSIIISFEEVSLASLILGSIIVSTLLTWRIQLKHTCVIILIIELNLSLS